jgi:predicted outer membrane repeat protein
VFNRGTVELYQSTLSGNSATGGNSDEKCALGQLCDGSGGGALSTHTAKGPQTRFNISLDADLSNNVAAALGGAIYSVGTVDVGGITVAGNKALNGGFLYYVHSGDSTQSYCNIRGDETYGPMSITGNRATSAQGYSIVAGDNDGIVSGPPGATPVRCNFAGVGTAYMTASQNYPLTPPIATRCQPDIVDTANSHCPQ